MTDGEAAAQVTALVPSIVKAAPMLRDLTNTAYAGRLPASWPFSMGRLPLAPATGDARLMHDITVSAFDEFERVAQTLVQQNSEVIPSLLAGVEVHSAAREAYVFGAAPFGVRRLDMLQTSDGPLVAENDEQPGGLGLAYLIDKLYDVNQDRWTRAWNELTSLGKLVFVVSHDWSAVYHGEMQWLTAELRQQGYDVDFLSTADLNRLTIHSEQMLLDGQEIGTVFRLFPVFEVSGRLIDIVQAAERGIVRMVPSFASWGNKTWFSLWGDYVKFFQHEMSETSFKLLSRVLPQTVLVRAGQFSRPFVLADGSTVSSIEELAKFERGQRRQVILKRVGANRDSTRSHGVLVGSSFKSGRPWREHLEKLVAGGPFVIQAYRKGEGLVLPAYSVLGDEPTVEQFECRVLVRPWGFGDVCVGAAVASPSNTSLIHGTTASALVPVQLQM